MELIVTHADRNSSIYSELYSQLLKSKLWKSSQKTNKFKCDLYLGERNKLPYSQLSIFQSGKKVLVNYYRGSDVICRKCELVRTVNKFGIDHSKWMPKSFVLTPNSTKVDDRQSLDEFMRANVESVFIAKATAGAKGDGILISNSFEEITEFVDGSKYSHVIQQYITNPLLLPNGNRKFDIRCWVLLNNDFNAYFYKYGVVRTCSEPYDGSDFSNKVAHLSNHCLQQELSTKFSHFEENNELFFDEFEGILLDFFDISLAKVLESCKLIAQSCLLAIRDRCKIDADSPMQHFQVFGFDYMLDRCGNVYLLEINGAPACAERLKRSFVSDLIALQMNPFFNLTHEEIFIEGCSNNFEPLF